MTQIPALLEKLDKEMMEGTSHIDGFIDDLQMFVDQREDEDVVGLENKLKFVDRGNELLGAKMKKEHFAKLLLKLTHSPSAQMVFAYFLSRIHEVFEAHVMHQGVSLPRQEVEQLVENMIVQPILADMGSGCEHLTLTPTHIRGRYFGWQTNVM